MTKKNTRRSRWDLLLILLPVLLGLGLMVLDSKGQQALRNNLFDQYQRWQPRQYTPVPVRIIDIDEDSLQRLGQWPWPRTLLAQLVDRLQGAGAAAIGFDVVFAEPDRTAPRAMAKLWHLDGAQRAHVLALPDHDQVFARSLSQSNAVLGFALDGSKGDAASLDALREGKAHFVVAGAGLDGWLPGFSGAVAPLPVLQQAAQGVGALSFLADSDGVVRRVPLVLQLGGAPVGTLAEECLRVAQGASNVVLKSAGAGAGLSEVRIGQVRVPTTPQGEMWVYYTQAQPQRYLPAWKVLQGQVDAAQLAGSIALVGSSAQGLMDLRFNPFGVVPGVEVQAQALEQILGGDYLNRPSWARGAEGLALIVGGALSGWLALRLRALSAAAITLGLLGAIVGGSWFAFVRYQLLLDMASPALGLLLSFTLCSLWHHFSSEREQRWIRQAFARYVSPNRVAHLIEHPDDMELGGLRQECSFIFTDLAGFTTLMERLDPAQAVSLLNAYLDAMIAISFRHEGTLDRIVGDAVAIMFSAPVAQADHRARALACALEMDAFASAYAQRLQAQGTAFGHTRIGVHGGEVIVGNFGGANIFDYRALGDPVNTAARLESVNKHLGTRLCVSQFILDGQPQTPVRPVGRLVLKGKSEALMVYEPLTATGPQRAPLADYDAAYAALRDGQASAQAQFEALLQHWPDDPLVRLHCSRLQAGERGDLLVMADK